MKKVIELITFLNDAGAENLIKHYCISIDKSKFEPIVVTVFDYHKDCDVYRTIAQNNVKIITLYPESWHYNKLFEKIKTIGQKNKTNLFSRVWNRLFADKINSYLEVSFEKRTGKKLGKMLKRISPEIVHAHLHVQNYLRWSNIDKSVRLFYTCHSEPYRYFSGSEYYSTKHLVENNGCRLIALHQKMQKEINDIFEINNTVVLNNFIDFSRFLNIKESKSSIRRSLNIPEDAFVIGTVGRIVEYKNQVFLVDVLKDLIEKSDNAMLIIAGTGNDTTKNLIICRAQYYNIEDKIVFLGVRQDIDRIYKAIDVFMLPSFFEGFAMVALEAQVCGTRCILSDSLPKELCLSNETFLLPIDNSEKWAEYAYSKSKNNGDFGNIDDYNIKNGIKELEKLYGE